jgi:tRNA ligase
MASLYRIGHIQSDNISGKKKNQFVNVVIDWLLSKTEASVIFADKNNHLGEHRYSIIDQFKKYFPNGRVIALYWNLDDMSNDDIVDIATRRILKRYDSIFQR